jgi:hypothetical protein
VLGSSYDGPFRRGHYDGIGSQSILHNLLIVRFKRVRKTISHPDKCYCGNDSKENDLEGPPRKTVERRSRLIDEFTILLVKGWFIFPEREASTCKPQERGSHMPRYWSWAP